MASLTRRLRPVPIPTRSATASRGRARANTYEQNEIVAAGHGFFGAVSKGLASAVEYAFKSQGRPNGYILGEDAGGAFVVGLRYGEGTLYTKDAGDHKVFWQGPSVGYDAGGDGSKTMVLVYNLRDPSEIYDRFGGAEGSAYLVGGVSVQFQKYGDVTLGAHPVGRRPSPRRQRRISEVYALTRRGIRFKKWHCRRARGLF